MTVMTIDPHGPAREIRSRPLAGAVVSTVPLVLLPFAVNVASDSLPGGAQRGAWLSWPAIIVLVVVSWRLGAVGGAAPPGNPTGPAPAPGGAADGYGPAAPGPLPWHPRAGVRAPGSRPARLPHPQVPFAVRSSPRPLRWLAVPVAGAITGLLLSQFHLVGVHPPFLAGVLVVIIAVVLCFVELISPRRVPRGAAAGLAYVLVAGAAVWRWDSSRADLWFVAESGVILGLGVYLATRVLEPVAWRRVVPGVVLTLLGWGAMGALFAIYQGDESDTTVANAAFFAGLAAVVAGAIATALQAVAARDGVTAGR
jgi:hypothetical protein